MYISVVYFVLVTVINILHELPNNSTIKRNYCYYPYFKYKETEV